MDAERPNSSGVDNDRLKMLKAFANLTNLYPTPHSRVLLSKMSRCILLSHTLVSMGYCSERWGMIKFKIAVLGYKLPKPKMRIKTSLKDKYG